MPFKNLLKIQYRIANSVDPDETARYEPSHLVLHCLQKYMFRCAGFKELTHSLLSAANVNVKYFSYLSFAVNRYRYLHFMQL